MSSVSVNDENRGVCPGGKHLKAIENTSLDDIFALEQPTGRPSILRQTENLPNKAVAKGVKVCFQTPRRDPHTKRILSPSKSVKMSNVDECMKAMELLHLENTNTSNLETVESSEGRGNAVSSYPDDNMPIQSKGGYQLDFDNLDAMDPFQGSGKMLSSPAGAGPVVEATPVSQSDPERTEEVSTAAVETPLDQTLPFNPSAENSLADASADVCSTESSVVTVTTNPAVDGEESSTATPDREPPAVVSLSVSQDTTAVASSVDDAPLPPKGSYRLDFDDLDSINPFQTGGSKMQNSPALGSKLLGTDQENLVVVTKVFQEASVQPDPKPVATVAPISAESSGPTDTEATVKPVGSPHNVGSVKLEFNFDDGAEVKRNLPPKKFGKRPPAVKPAEKKAALGKNSVPLKEEAVAADADQAPVPKATYSFDFDKLDDPDFNPFGTNSKSDNSLCGVKSSPLDEVPPPAKEMTTKVPPPAKEMTTKVPPPAKEMTTKVPPPAKEMTTKVPPPAKEMTTKVPPPAKEMTTKVPPPAKEMTTKVPPPAKEMTVSEQESKHLDNKVLHSCAGDDVLKPEHNPAEGLVSHAEAPVEHSSEPIDLGQHEWNSQSVLLGNSEEFVPGTTFLSSDFEGQIDYLEQFGSSIFKESALRKQSLYLKFDPLLRESPKKCGASALHNQAQPPRPTTMASRFESEPTTDNFKLIDAPPAVDPVVQNSQMLKSVVPETNTENAIVDVLKYSQKDMDAAIATIKAEAKQKEEQGIKKYEMLSKDGQEMRNIISEFELTIAKMSADHQKERAAAQAKLDDALLEKEQVSADLNGMERSCSELFKRLEKYKAVVEGYKKNEETLKGCAQEYLARIKKEEQRYQTLKAHAEEKITLANEEIAEVRSKLRAEVSGLQAQLRREQLKALSLEKNFDQKVKEVQELSNLCDELIANVQKG